MSVKSGEVKSKKNAPIMCSQCGLIEVANKGDKCLLCQYYEGVTYSMHHKVTEEDDERLYQLHKKIATHQQSLEEKAFDENNPNKEEDYKKYKRFGDLRWAYDFYFKDDSIKCGNLRKDEVRFLCKKCHKAFIGYQDVCPICNTKADNDYTIESGVEDKDVVKYWKNLEYEAIQKQERAFSNNNDTKPTVNRIEKSNKRLKDNNLNISKPRILKEITSSYSNPNYDFDKMTSMQKAYLSVKRKSYKNYLHLKKNRQQLASGYTDSGKAIVGNLKKAFEINNRKLEAKQKALNGSRWHLSRIVYSQQVDANKRNLRDFQFIRDGQMKKIADYNRKKMKKNRDK